MLTNILRTQNTFVGMRKKLPYFQVEAALSISWQVDHWLNLTGSENLGSIQAAQTYTAVLLNMTRVNNK